MKRVKIISDQIIGGELIFYWTTAGHLDFNYPDTLRTSKKSDLYSQTSRKIDLMQFFFTILARTWLCFPVTVNVIRRRDNAISTHQKILTIYSLQDDKTHSNYVNTRNKNLIIQSYRSTSLKFLFVLCSQKCFAVIYRYLLENSQKTRFDDNAVQM